MTEMKQNSSFDIVMFLPTGDWEVNTRQRMIIALAKALERHPYRGRVLCVERPICPFSSPLLHTRKYLEWLRGKRRLRQIETNIFLLTPFVLLHDSVARKFPFVTKMNKILLKRTVTQALVYLRFRFGELISWVFHPYQLYWAELFQGRLLIYECYDEYSEYANVRGHPAKVSMICEFERLLLQKADVVFVTSRSLLQSRKKINDHTYFLPNGVEFEHFYTPLRDFEIPNKMRDIPRPIVGFAGTINEKIDYGLIGYLSRAHPEWSIVMLGRFTGRPFLRIRKDFLNVSIRANVHFCGGVDYQVVPRYVHNFDVCLIPLVIDKQTEKAYPLKLHEYLATGKPVVSTALSEVEQYSEVVRIGRNYSEFEHAVVESLAEREENLREKRIMLARKNTWAKRAECALSIISDAFAGNK